MSPQSRRAQFAHLGYGARIRERRQHQGICKQEGCRRLLCQQSIGMPGGQLGEKIIRRCHSIAEEKRPQLEASRTLRSSSPRNAPMSAAKYIELARDQREERRRNQDLKTPNRTLARLQKNIALKLNQQRSSPLPTTELLIF